MLQKNRAPIEEKLMFILKEISFNKYKLLVFQEQLKEEEGKNVEKKRFFSFFFWKKQKDPKQELLTGIKKVTEEIKTLKKAHNDTFYGLLKINYFDKILFGRLLRVFARS